VVTGTCVGQWCTHGRRARAKWVAVSSPTGTMALTVDWHRNSDVGGIGRVHRDGGPAAPTYGGSSIGTMRPNERYRCRCRRRACWAGGRRHHVAGAPPEPAVWGGATGVRLKVLGLHPTLMSAQQPPLRQARHAMHGRQQLVRWQRLPGDGAAVVPVRRLARDPVTGPAMVMTSEPGSMLSSTNARRVGPSASGMTVIRHRLAMLPSGSTSTAIATIVLPNAPRLPRPGSGPPKKTSSISTCPASRSRPGRTIAVRNRCNKAQAVRIEPRSSTRFRPNAEIPFFWVVMYHTAANHSVSGVRGPAETDYCNEMENHSCHRGLADGFPRARDARGLVGGG
jgi:hypothetical protein